MKFTKILHEAGFDMKKINEQINKTGNAYILAKDLSEDILEKINNL